MQLDAEGIWVSRDCANLSYPEGGNESCFQVEDASFWFQHRNDCIMAALRRHPPAGPMLDVGGGNGYVTRRALDEGFEAALVEPGPVGALNAKRRRQIPEVFCSTLEGCGFAPDSIAAVGLFDVLEHIEDEAAFLASIQKVLKPGGHLYLTVPAFGWLWSDSDDDAGHYRRYSPANLREALGNRFDVLALTCFFRVLALPVLACRVVPYRLGLTRHREKMLSTETEHGTGGGVAVSVLRRLLSHEGRDIESGKPRAFGGSCLCVATKRV